MLNNHQTIVISVDHYNTLDLIRCLGVEGINPIYIAVKGKSTCASKSRYIKQLFPVDSVEEGLRYLLGLKNGISDFKPIIYTADDKTQSFLDANYDALKDDFILFNAGSNGRITKFMDKKRILELAERHGLDCLPTIVVNKNEMPEDIDFPVITKSISPIIGGWKSDVFICHNKDELARAFTKIKSPQVLIQKFINKKNECCIDGFSYNNGKDVINVMSSTYNYNIEGYYSPYMTVVPFDLPTVQIALEGMMAEVGFEGIYSAEFLIDENGKYYFSEINFRNSTWNYAVLKAGINVPVLWGEAMTSNVFDKDAISSNFAPFRAVVEPIDYQKRVVEGGMPLNEWIVDILSCKCFYYFDNDDLEPFFQMIRDNEVLR